MPQPTLPGHLPGKGGTTSLGPLMLLSSLRYWGQGLRGAWVRDPGRGWGRDPPRGAEGWREVGRGTPSGSQTHRGAGAGEPPWIRDPPKCTEPGRGGERGLGQSGGDPHSLDHRFSLGLERGEEGGRGAGATIHPTIHLSGSGTWCVSGGRCRHWPRPSSWRASCWEPSFSGPCRTGWCQRAGTPQTAPHLPLGPVGPILPRAV